MSKPHVAAPAPAVDPLAVVPACTPFKVDTDIIFKNAIIKDLGDANLTRVEDPDDGYLYIAVAALGTMDVVKFRMTPVTARRFLTEIRDRLEAMPKEKRRKLIQDLTDREYAEVMKAKERAPDPIVIEEPEEEEPKGLLGRVVEAAKVIVGKLERVCFVSLPPSLAQTSIVAGLAEHESGIGQGQHGKGSDHRLRLRRG